MFTDLEKLDDFIPDPREQFALLQRALTESENRHAKRDRQDAALVKVLQRVADSGLFDHRQCLSAPKELDENCLCGYTELASALIKCTVMRAAEVTERADESRELKDKLKEFMK